MGESVDRTGPGTREAVECLVPVHASPVPGASRDDERAGVGRVGARLRAGGDRSPERGDSRSGIRIRERQLAVAAATSWPAFTAVARVRDAAVSPTWAAARALPRRVIGRCGA